MPLTLATGQILYNREGQPFTKLGRIFFVLGSPINPMFISSNRNIAGASCHQISLCVEISAEMWHLKMQ
jgi:hypothetical protein